MSDMHQQRDDANGVIRDKHGKRFYRGTELASHEYVEDGLVIVGDLPVEVKAPKVKGERAPRRTFKDIQGAVAAMNEVCDANYWVVDGAEGIIFVQDETTVRTFNGEDKKMDYILKWIEGFNDCLSHNAVEAA